MLRLTSTLLLGSALWLTSGGSAEQARDRAAATLASSRLEQWLGPAATPPAAPSPGRPRRWLVSAYDVGPQRAVVRAVVEKYTSNLLADERLGDALTAYLTSRITEDVFQQQMGTTLGAAFLVERYFGGLVPYAIRSIRLAPQQLAPAEPFDTLERYVGWPTLDEILREFYAARHGTRASKAAFIEACNRVSGRELDWLFAATSGDEGRLDYGVGEVVAGPSSDGRQRTTVQVRRYGDAVFAGTNRPPDGAFQSGRAVAVRVTFAGGAVRNEHWDGRARWTTFVYDSSAPVTTVVVDPDRVIAADRNTTNNGWTRDPRAGAAADKWAGRWLNWLAGRLLGWAFFV